MANTFNAITTGTGGISTTGDTSGTFAFTKDGGAAVVTISGTGVINASAVTGLTTALTVAQGGTGAATLTANNVLLGNGTSALQVVAPGTSGNVLTSNGTTWSSTALPAGGVTSLNGQTGAITDTTSGAIGSYAIASAINTTVARGSTVAGSSLNVLNTNTSEGPIRELSSSNSTSGGYSGTWRAMTFTPSSASIGWPAGWAIFGLFVRIS
jgi:hypothetical protein